MKHFSFYYKGSVPCVTEKHLPMIQAKREAFVTELAEDEDQMESIRRVVFEQNSLLFQALDRGETSVIVLHQAIPSHLGPGQKAELEEERLDREQALYTALVREIAPRKYAPFLSGLEITWLLDHPEGDFAALPKTPGQKVAELVQTRLQERKLHQIQGIRGRRKRMILAKKLRDEHRFFQDVFHNFGSFLLETIESYERDFNNLYHHLLTRVLNNFPKEFREKRLTLKNRIQMAVNANPQLGGFIQTHIKRFYDKKAPDIPTYIEQLVDKVGQKEQMDGLARDLVVILLRLYHAELSQKREAIEQANALADKAIQAASKAVSETAKYKGLWEREAEELEQFKTRLGELHLEVVAARNEESEVSVFKEGTKALISSIASQKVKRQNLEEIAEVKRQAQEAALNVDLATQDVEKQQRLERHAYKQYQNALREENRTSYEAEKATADAKRTALDKRRETGAGETFVNLFIRHCPYYPILRHEDDEDLRSPAEVPQHLNQNSALPGLLLEMLHGHLPEDKTWPTPWEYRRDPTIWERMRHLERCIAIYVAKSTLNYRMLDQILAELRFCYAQFTFINSYYPVFATPDCSPLAEIPANMELAFTSQKPLGEILMEFRLYREVWDQTVNYTQRGKSKAVKTALDTLKKAIQERYAD